jgi:hypothetical protein
MLASLPQTLSTLSPYLVTKSGSGMSMVTKSPLHTVVPTLLSPQTTLCLLYAMRRLSQSKTLIPEQLWLNSRWPVMTLNTAVSLQIAGLLLLLLVGLSMFGTSPTQTPTLLRPLLVILNVVTSLVFSSPSSLISASIDKSVKFWQIGALSKDPVATNLESTPIYSVSLQASCGIAISSDEEGCGEDLGYLNWPLQGIFPNPS